MDSSGRSRQSIRAGLPRPASVLGLKRSTRKPFWKAYLVFEILVFLVAGSIAPEARTQETTQQEHEGDEIAVNLAAGQRHHPGC